MCIKIYVGQVLQNYGLSSQKLNRHILVKANETILQDLYFMPPALEVSRERL